MSECGRGWARRCANSKSPRCRCRCGGVNHGKAAPREERGDLFNPEGEPFVIERRPQLVVGCVVELKIPCLGNPAGTLGVCYEAYEIAGRPGWSFIFENGNYDGFSRGEVYQFLRPVGFSPALSGYQFSHVIRLSQDFEHGVFKPAFEGAKEASPV